MSKVKTKVVKGFYDLYQVEFWIDQQGFRLQEVEGYEDEGVTSKQRAKWYEGQLNVALERLIKTSFEAGWKMCDDHVDIGGGPLQIKADYEQWKNENRF